MTTEEQFVSLEFTGGGSDKVYQLWLYCKGGEWAVDYANARRGGTLTRKAKIGLTDYLTAHAAFKKAVAEKTRKGYVNSETGSAMNPAMEAENSGVVLNLLNPIEDPGFLLDAPNWFMQIKKDGERRAVVFSDAGNYGINRRGLKVAIPSTWDCRRDCIVDGEVVGPYLWVFDILEMDGRDLRGVPFAQRVEILDELWDDDQFSLDVYVLKSWIRPKDKHAMFVGYRERNVEGVVFKKGNATYEPGRPNAGGSYLKYKFYDTASVIVTEHNLQRSVKTAMIDGELGNVTIPPNYDVPPVGAVVEVRYLNYMPGGALIQPTYLGERNDISKEECTLDQLKTKEA